jgi:hypothetical protein
MATFPLITANDDQFPAVWHVGVGVSVEVPWNSANYTLASGLPGGANPFVAFDALDYSVTFFYFES